MSANTFSVAFNGFMIWWLQMPWQQSDQVNRNHLQDWTFQNVFPCQIFQILSSSESPKYNTPCQMATISQTFSSAFPWIKTSDSLKINFIRICSLGSNWTYKSIGSDNGLMLNRQQAIIWTNDMFYWCMYVSLGLNQLKSAHREICKFHIIKGNTVSSPQRSRDLCTQKSWWHHDMETLSALLALCAGNPCRQSRAYHWFPHTKGWSCMFVVNPLLLAWKNCWA